MKKDFQAKLYLKGLEYEDLLGKVRQNIREGNYREVLESCKKIKNDESGNSYLKEYCDEMSSMAISLAITEHVIKGDWQELMTFFGKVLDKEFRDEYFLSRIRVEPHTVIEASIRKYVDKCKDKQDYECMLYMIKFFSAMYKKSKYNEENGYRGFMDKIKWEELSEKLKRDYLDICRKDDKKFSNCFSEFLLHFGIPYECVSKIREALL